ncbi:hypothetical protein P152DRAFT_457269 [Eremomyces bilateralis CBS 781.70]|uniref:Chromatin assembly factor 1 subunit A n=1 Tax=Eremomyces bilateralis CBS 781.70 TaxID=1392243 RepID=A0A6G1G7M7_9PEZI|nr:uncharacterized protein P152DRAFT_457269 [Eremomyces bilateralis CBS 781.70]KAF1813890.1 hypothetical protein P152DRAFT_457269 [Eremomyces bilateralis CBS 781.70]
MTVEALTPSKKRAFDADPSTVPTNAALQVSPEVSGEDSRGSPAPSTLTSLSETPVPTIELSAGAKSGQPPAKRRKMTPQEKEAQRLEKEWRAREKEEQKRAKAEEKRVRDEEKRKKHEELEEKRREKDLKKLQAEQEKQKKERSQLRLNAFFIGPKATKPFHESPEKHRYITKEAATRRSLSIDPIDSLKGSGAGRSPKSSRKPLTDYEAFFLSYFPPSNTILAPYNPQLPPPDKLPEIRARMDEYSRRPTETSTWLRICSDFNIVRRPPSQNLSPSVRDIMAEINGSAMKPVDLTSECSLQASRSPLETLQSIPMKYIHFGEDVRPPYYGTFTRVQDRSLALKLCRNPTSRSIPDINYDYDSEAEWEEADDGEDLASNDDDEESVEGEEDMDGFLDDDGAVEPVKPRAMLGGTELVPVSTGICWQDQKASSRNADTNEIALFPGYKMGVLMVPPPASIDPYSVSYWEKVSPKPTASGSSLFAKLSSGKSSMDPPRLPLTVRPNSFLNGSNTGPIPTKSIGAKALSAAPGQKRLVGSEQLPEFKQAIEGSDLTKIAIVEDLKKRFPKIPKDAIINTLNLVAERIGPKATEKRWVLRPETA